jgi:hypothetical protein
MEPSTLAIVLGLVGLVCLIQFIRSVRGQRVGATPHCRSCGYDLTGRPAESMQCSECGARLSRRSAIVHGEKRRSGKQIAIWGSLSAGLLLSAMSFSVAWLVHYPWIHLAPANWLITDIDGPPSQKRTDAGAELRRRFALSSGLDATRTSSLIETLLKMHADQSAVWDQLSVDLFSDTVSAGRLSDVQLQRFLEQSLDVRLETHPFIRRGKYTMLNASVKLVRMPFTVSGQFDQGDVLLNEKATLYSFGPTGKQGTASAPARISGMSTTACVTPTSKMLAEISNGPVTLSYVVNFSVCISSPFVSHRLQFSKKATRAVELAPADAITDRFTVDKMHTVAADYGVVDVSVTNAHGKVAIEARIKSPPINLAMDVLVRPGGRNELPWQNAGIVRAAIGSADTWYHGECDARGLEFPAVDILLRPSQDAADEFNQSSSPYCGNELLLPAVAVLPVGSLSQFVSDPALRQKVKDAVQVRPITGGRTQYDFSVAFGASSVTLFMDCFVRAGSREVLVQRGLRWGSTDAQRVNISFSGMSYGLRFTLPEHPEQLRTVDVILRPIPESGERPAGDSKPWGEEIVFKDLPLPKPATP